MKSSKKIIIFAIAVILAAAYFFLKKETKVSEITNGIGIKTSLINVKNNDVVYIKCIFENAGILHNSMDKHGISVIVEHLLFNKICKLSPEETQDKFLELGIGDLSVNAREDNFEISFHIIKDKAKKSLLFLSNAFTNPTFTDGDLENAKEMFPNVLDVELSHPSSLLMDKMLSMLYADGAYGMNNTGTSQSISSITSSEIRSFIKKELTKKNLNVVFAGDISRLDACLYLKYLFNGVSDEYQNHGAQKIELTSSENQIFTINKPGMKDIAAIMVGIRIDKLTDIERAAAYIVMDAIFDEKTGDFLSELKSENIACKIDHCSIKRSLSNTFYISVFLEKKDIEKFQRYLDEKISQYNLKIDLKELQKTQNYLIEKSKNGFSDLSDVDEKIYNSSLPFEDVTPKTFEKVIKMIFNKENTRTVLCYENIL